MNRCCCEEGCDWEASGHEDLKKIYEQLKKSESVSFVDILDEIMNVENIIFMAIKAMSAEKDYTCEKIANSLMFNALKPLETIRKALQK